MALWMTKYLDHTQDGNIPFLQHGAVYLLALHLRLPLIKGDVPLDLIHIGQRIGIIPRRIFDLSLVGCDGVVRGVAFVGAVGFGGCRPEVGLGYAVGWELWKG